MTMVNKNQFNLKTHGLIQGLVFDMYIVKELDLFRGKHDRHKVRHQLLFVPSIFEKALGLVKELKHLVVEGVVKEAW